MARRSSVNATLLAALIGCATLPALGCKDLFWDTHVGNGSESRTVLYSVSFSPYMPFPDMDLYVTLNYMGRYDSARVHWFLNRAPLPNLTNLMRMPAGTAKVGDTVLVRARVLFGKDSTDEQSAFAVVQPIPTLSARAFILNYLDLKPVAGLVAILNASGSYNAYSVPSADTATTDLSGSTLFTVDARAGGAFTLTVDGKTSWYSVSRTAWLSWVYDPVTGIGENEIDTVRMIPRLVDANSVDQLDYCRRVTGTTGTAGGATTLVSWGKPLLMVYLNRPSAPAGVADSVWQGFSRWNVARGVPLFVETPLASSSSDVVVVFDTATTPSTVLTNSSVNWPMRLTKATIHVPLNAQPDTAFVRKMVHEAGHAQGLGTDFSQTSYAMSSSGAARIPQGVEIGCSLMLSSLPTGLDLGQYR